MTNFWNTYGLCRSIFLVIFPLLIIFNSPSFLVGRSDLEIDLVGKLYPDDPTKVCYLTRGVITGHYVTCIQGSPFGVGTNDTLTYVLFILQGQEPLRFL